MPAIQINGKWYEATGEGCNEKCAVFTMGPIPNECVELWKHANAKRAVCGFREVLAPAACKRCGELREWLLKIQTVNRRSDYKNSVIETFCEEALKEDGK